MDTPVQPLPHLDTMVALCSEARDALRREIRSNPDLADMRWLQDREPVLYAIGSDGQRLNDGEWRVWHRLKGDAQALLTDYPDAVKIVVNSGINVSVNKQDLDAGYYEPMFWQTTIWKRHAPVYSDAELEELIRRRTGFRGFDDMFKAKGSYRPSIDVRDPEMKAIGDRYDALASARNDDRRAYRYGEPPPAARRQTCMVGELTPGDTVLIGTMDDPTALQPRTVASATVAFGLNAWLRFTDGTERALRDDERVERVPPSAVAADQEENLRPRP